MKTLNAVSYSQEWLGKELKAERKKVLDEIEKWAESNKSNEGEALEKGRTLQEGIAMANKVVGYNQALEELKSYIAEARKVIE